MRGVCLVNKEEKLKQLLHPERHISDVNVDELRVNVQPSGFASLDDYMFLQENIKQLIVIGAKASTGKSAFIAQLAENIAKTGPVYVQSLEMDRVELTRRILASRLNVTIEQIQRGRISKEQLENGLQEMRSLGYYIDDRAGLDVNDIVIAISEAHSRHGLKAAFIDHLQRVKRPKGHSKEDEVGQITGRLAQLSKDLRIPIVLCCQLNREMERRGTQTGNFKPFMSDLRDSSSIEQDADTVMFLFRQSIFTGERKGEIDLIFAKNRNGKIGEITMGFSEMQCKFIDWFERSI